MKPFLTIDDQLNLLTSRNLTIIDREAAGKYLLTNNYYNVINGYSKFLFNAENSYYDGATFDEIRAIHWYDKEIKGVLLKSIIEAEKHFKSVVAYRFSECYQDSYSYLDINNFSTNNEPQKIAQVSHLISIMAKIIKDQSNSRNNNAIKHYLLQHGTLPFWVLVNELTFGQIFNFYKYLDAGLKDRIARDLSSFLQQNIENRTGLPNQQIISGATLLKFLKNILEIRNVTAHNNRLFSYLCRDNLPQQSWFDNNPTTSKQTVFYVIQSLQCLLSKTQYAILWNTILRRSKALD